MSLRRDEPDMCLVRALLPFVEAVVATLVAMAVLAVVVGLAIGALQ